MTLAAPPAQRCAIGFGAARATLRQGVHPAGRRDSGGQGDFPRSPCPEGRQMGWRAPLSARAISRAQRAAEATLRRGLAPVGAANRFLGAWAKAWTGRSAGVRRRPRTWPSRRVQDSCDTYKGGRKAAWGEGGERFYRSPRSLLRLISQGKTFNAEWQKKSQPYRLATIKTQ